MALPTAYCTVADLEVVIGAEALLTAAPDLSSGTPAIDTAAVERAIVSVSSRIDGWLRTRYTLPLPDVPEVLRRAAARLVHAELVSESTTTELIESRAAESQKLLEHMAAGRIRIGGDLDGDPTDANASSGHSRAHTTRRDLKHGQDTLRGIV